MLYNQLKFMLFVFKGAEDEFKERFSHFQSENFTASEPVFDRRGLVFLNKGLCRKPYLRLFDRVLVLLYFRMPPHLMRQVTGHSLALINEHLALAKKHFPAEKDLVGYLTNRGVDLEKAQ